MKARMGSWMAAAVVSSALVLSGSGSLHAAGLAAGLTVGLTANLVGSPVLASYAQEGGWEAPPPELDEVSRRGFHDGVEGARKDYGNKRRPDVNNRDEFRHPHVPDRDKEAYRRGYARGYQAGVDHLYQGRL